MISQSNLSFPSARYTIRWCNFSEEDIFSYKKSTLAFQGMLVNEHRSHMPYGQLYRRGRV